MTDKMRVAEAMKEAFLAGWQDYEAGVPKYKTASGEELGFLLLGKHKMGVQGGLKRAYTTGYWMASSESGNG